ncbi:TetR/AcrR family transcriptional regulator [Nocardia araoensis]|uniref:TetR/AcrR family transcriptional regulator n=1 Tax=Nocardia araoensis TaxID=228600 RepID=UPI0002E79C42|nr:TetR/AcrR family transcriptional regulator [Nocardia araoensis]
MPTQAKQRLLTTAEELFYAEGIRAVGIDRLLQESGVGRASFYRHFASKDDLVVAVLEDRDRRWLDWLRESVEQTGDPTARPLAVFDALAQRFARNDFRGCAFINTMVEVADRESAAHRVADRHKRRVIEYLNELLAEAGRSDAEELAAELALLVDGAIVTAVREGTPEAAHRARTIAERLLATQ